MAERIRPEARYAAALVIVGLFPIHLVPPLAALVFVPGIAAVIFLWFVRGYRLLAAATIISLIAITVVFGYLEGLFFMLGFVIPALILAGLQQRGLGLVRSGMVAMLPPAVGLAAMYGTLREIVQFAADELKRFSASPEVAKLYSSAEYERWIASLDWTAEAVMVLLPAILIATVVVIVFAGGALGIILVRRQGVFVYGTKPFSRWRLPEWLLLPLALAVILILTEIEALAVFGWNVLFVLFLLYSICGLSLVEYVMRKRQVSVSVKVLIYVGLFFAQIVAAVVLPLAALFDSHFDFRSLRAKQIG